MKAKIAVIGAGAAGLTAARKAALTMKNRGLPGSVVLLEGNPKPGKKLLATGNGRCNLTNLDIVPEHYHGDPLAAELLDQFPARRILNEFKGLGLGCTADGEGRVYPNSRQAAAVLQLLWRACEALGVELVTGFEAVRITPGAAGFEIFSADGRRVAAQKCILACGGAAAPGHSQGKSGYRLAEALGHSVTPLSPSLVPLKTPAKACRALKGIRCRAGVTLYDGEKKVYGESGEVIFGDDALSGICIFNLSARLREVGPRAQVGLDLLEKMTVPEITAFLQNLRGSDPDGAAAELFSGLLNLRVGRELVKLLGIPREAALSQLADRDLERAAESAKDWRFPVTGPGDWTQAQVTAGGVSLGEVDLATLESKRQPGLYLAGELLDADGDCGGFNLHWAWLTGLLAGESAAHS